MGADYVGSVTPISRTRDEALALLDAMSIKEIIKRNEEFYTVVHYAIEDGDFDIETDDDAGFVLDESQVRSRCREAVNIAYDCYEGRLRLGGSANFGEVGFAIAGGASWGDVPDYVDDLSIAQALRVTYDDTKELKWV